MASSTSRGADGVRARAAATATRASSIAVALWLLGPGCARAASVGAAEAGAPPPNKPLRFVDGGPPPDARVTCGGTACDEPRESQVLGEIACCLPSGDCGIRVPLLGNRCFAKAHPGSVDPKCPSATMPNGASVQGCCGPEGRCGYYDRFGDLGCAVPDTSDAGARCDYDPENVCRSLVAVPCDGPEDCTAGGVCCARSNYGLTDLVGCFRSCRVAEASNGGVWLEACHSRADCRDPNARCVPAEDPPTLLAICLPSASLRPPDAGPLKDGGPLDANVEPMTDAAASDARGSADGGSAGVVCGSSRCAAGQLCCVRDPEASYCAPPADGCSCSGPRARDD